MSRKLVDPMPHHPSLCCPGTNAPLEAVAVHDGLPLWPLLGGDGDEGEGDEGEEPEESDDEEEDESEEEDAASTSKKSKRSGPVSREEFEAQTNRLRAADKRRAEAEKKAAALQAEKDEADRKGKPELDNVKKDLETITKDHEKLQTR